MRTERVRALSGPDRQKLVDFWIEGWTRTIPDIDFAAQRDWLSNHLDGLMAGGAWLLVTRAEGGELTGFLTVHPETGTVDQLAVDPAHAGRGFARALIEEAKRVAPAGLNLRVNKANARAFALYRRAGFAVIGEDISARSGLPVWSMAWGQER